MLSNDSDPDDDILTIVTVTDPAHGTTRIVAGNIVYPPDAGYVVSDTFTYTVQDPSGATDTATVTVVITPKTTSRPTRYPTWPRSTRTAASRSRCSTTTPTPMATR